MFLSADLVNLLLYCSQQLGVTLGVGAETIMLAAYLIAMRDGVVDAKETQYARAIRRTMAVALILIVISGLGISALHIIAGKSSILATPAYLFKILLILLVGVLTLARRSMPQSSWVEGLIGGTWYALFLVHILAPVTGWANLFVMYAVWLVGFVICWEILVVMRRDKKPGIVSTPVPKAEPHTKIEPPKKEEPKPAPPKPEIKPDPIPVPVPTPMPTVVLAPDLPHAPPPPPVPLLVSTPVPTPTPAPMPPPKLEEITLTGASPFESIAPSPKGKVTDTPFLPKVPPLQPIPTTPGTPLASAPPAPPVAPASPMSAPVTTIPGGTSTSGLGITVMPKSPDDLKK